MSAATKTDGRLANRLDERRPRTDASNITCYRCGEKGHHATSCMSGRVGGGSGSKGGDKPVSDRSAKSLMGEDF